ncbi:hypothetical protein C8J56DRAFT_1025822, partial [Mycena floridula]
MDPIYQRSDNNVGIDQILSNSVTPFPSAAMTDASSRQISLWLRLTESGSLTAIGRLASSQMTDEGLLTGFFDTIFRHLAVSPPSNMDITTAGSPVAAVPNFQLVVSCLSGLGKHLGRSRSEDTKLFIRAYVQNHWTILRPWLIFIVSDLLEPQLLSVTDSPSADGLYSVASAVLAGLGAKGDPTILMTRGFASLCVRLWICSLRENRHDLALRGVMFFLGDIPVLENTNFVDTIISIPDAPELFLASLNHATSNMSTTLGIFSILALGNIRCNRRQFLAFRHELHARRWIPVVCQTFSELNKSTLPKSTAYKLALRCLGVITQCLISEGPLRVRDVLHAGLIDSLASFLIVFGEILDGITPENDVAFRGLLKVIMRHTLHPLVLREARKWFVHQWRDVGGTNRFCQAWRALVRHLKIRISLRSEWKRAPLTLCANGTNCRSLEMAFLEMKRCSGCLSVAYRSRSCQKEHWTTAHSIDCQQGLSGISNTLFKLHCDSKVNRYKAQRFIDISL